MSASSWRYKVKAKTWGLAQKFSPLTQQYCFSPLLHPLKSHPFRSPYKHPSLRQLFRNRHFHLHVLSPWAPTRLALPSFCRSHQPQVQLSSASCAKQSWIRVLQPLPADELGPASFQE